VADLVQLDWHPEAARVFVLRVLDDLAKEARARIMEGRSSRLQRFLVCFFGVFFFGVWIMPPLELRLSYIFVFMHGLFVAIRGGRRLCSLRGAKLLAAQLSDHLEEL